MKILLLICCCFVSAILQGQISIVNLTDRDSTSKTLVLDNPYLFRISNLPPGAQLEMSQGTTHYVGDNIYSIGVSSCSRTPISKAVLFIYNNHHDLLYTQTFHLRYQPDTNIVTATLANSCGYDITAAELCADPHLRLTSSRYKVLIFNISVMRLRGCLDRFYTFNQTKVSGADVTKCWFDRFNLKPGDRLFVDNIKAQCAGCRDTANIEPMVIHIKK